MSADSTTPETFAALVAERDRLKADLSRLRALLDAETDARSVIVGIHADIARKIAEMEAGGGWPERTDMNVALDSIATERIAAYGLRCREEGREEAAKVCDAVSDGRAFVSDSRGQDASDECATKIRALDARRDT